MRIISEEKIKRYKKAASFYHSGATLAECVEKFGLSHGSLHRYINCFGNGTRSPTESFASPKYREKRRKVWLGRKHKKSTLAKQSIAATLRWKKYSKKERRKILAGTIAYLKSEKHRNLARELNSGVAFSRIRCKRISESNKKRLKNVSREQIAHAIERMNNARKGNKNTSIEIILNKLLEESNVHFIPQYKLYGFIIDAYSPEYKIAWEANGSYWHSLPTAKLKDARKRACLARHGIRMVVFSEKSLRRKEKCLLKIRRLVHGQ